MSDEVPTIDFERLAAWMDDEGLPGKGEPIEHAFIAGGSQNEIYEIRRGELHGALRIPPPTAPMSRDERMILNNYKAMERIREMRERPLTRDGLLELHHILTDGTLEDPAHAGQIQKPGEPRVQVIDHRINRAVHDPPPADQLPERLERLVEFANGDDICDGQYIHPVLRSILLHFQLAYDHPFHDGNGRTARALFYWSMLRQGYWLTEYLTISAILKQAPARYARYISIARSRSEPARGTRPPCCRGWSPTCTRSSFSSRWRGTRSKD